MTGLRVKDTQARDKNSEPRYRTRQGKHYPVHDLPHGLAVVEHRRSDGARTASVPVESKLVTRMLILLQQRPTYLSIHEKKIEAAPLDSRNFAADHRIPRGNNRYSPLGRGVRLVDLTRTVSPET
jgi:hypothetical protein